MTAQPPPEAPAEQHTARERLEARLFTWARRALAVLPLSWVSAFGAGFGWFLFRVTGFARARALRNLEIAFGGTLSERERWHVARRCYQLYGAMVAEFLSLPRLKPQDLPRHLTMANPEVLDALLAQHKGVLLFAAHFGSWEVFGAGLCAAGYPFTVYTGGQRNLLVDHQINAIRAATGQNTVSRWNGGARGLLRGLKAKHVTGLVADQHESTKRHYVSFFGQPVSVAPGPYLLARHTGAPVVFATTVCVGPFRYRATFETIPGPQPGAEEELDLLEFLQRAFAKLERDVRAHPDHYFWMHRRFRPIPAEVTLTPTNRAFLEGRLSGPVDSFWERPEAASPAADRQPSRADRPG